MSPTKPKFTSVPYETPTASFFSAFLLFSRTPRPDQNIIQRKVGYYTAVEPWGQGYFVPAKLSRYLLGLRPTAEPKKAFWAVIWAAISRGEDGNLKRKAKTAELREKVSVRDKTEECWLLFVELRSILIILIHYWP